MSMGITMVKRTPRCLTAEIAQHAEKIVVCAICVLCGFFPAVAAATPPVRSMYNNAMAREQKVRAALSAPDAAPVLLGDVRAVVAAYEAVVRHYPASGYSDNALWQGGRLSLDAFARFGQTPDKDAGVRILRRLASGYPTSKLAKQVSEQLTRASADGDPAARPEGRAPQETKRTAAPSTIIANEPAADRVPNVGAGLQAGPPTRSALATIKDIRRAVLPDAVRITIELDSEVAFHEERIPDPARVFVDLPGTRAAPGLVDQTLRFEGDADIVRQVRIGRHPNNTTRVVLEAAGVTSYSVYPLYSPYRLVIDCVRVPAAVAAAAMTDKVLGRVAPAAAATARQNNEAAAAARPLAPLAARTMTNPWLRKLPGLSPRSTALLASIAVAPQPAPVTPAVIENVALAAAAAPPARHGAEVALVTGAPAHNANGGLSMARQLGLGVSRIVIDPGHGGHDPGAKGKGVSEAELVLDVALRLEKLLQQVPGVDVILTRRTDEFIQLPERTAIANREGADLFLSIHANASASAQAHGIETYFLNFANNQSAAAVAARENAASTQAMGGLPDFVKAIAMNNKLDESRDFALHVQRSMVERQRAANKTLRDLGVKQAPFVVLIGANMPSVLAEMGFVTNAQEAKLLKANAYRQKIAESLFNAIRKYQTSLKNISTVALQ
jgi:N-acetylmuramoyl-L-alanine amidase